MVAKRPKNAKSGASGRKALAYLLFFRLGLAWPAVLAGVRTRLDLSFGRPHLFTNTAASQRAASTQHAERLYQQPARQPGAAAQRRTRSTLEERGPQPRHVFLVPELRESF